MRKDKPVDIKGVEISVGDKVYFTTSTATILEGKVDYLSWGGKVSIAREDKIYSKGRPHEQIVIIKKAPKPHPASQPVGMFNKNNHSKLYWAFPSIHAAERDFFWNHFKKTGERKHHGDIRKAINGEKKYAYGKIWKKLTREEYDEWERY